MHFRFLAIFATGLLFTITATTARAARTVASTTVTTTAPRASDVSLDFSGGLVTMGGTYGGTFLIGVGLPVAKTSPVRLELQSGVTVAGGTALPILLSVLYEFRSGVRNAVIPYIGGAVGPEIGLSSNMLGINLPTIGYGIQLAILVRPGLKFTVADNLDVTVEAPLGGITGVFYIAPTLGLSLRL